MAAIPSLEFSVSAASRHPRPHEIDGRDYYFMTAEQFREKIRRNDLLEWQEVYEDHFYGTLKSEVERIWQNNHHVLFDVDVQGGMNLKRLFPDISLSLFIMPPSLQELEKRLRLRGTETEDTLKFRLEKAASELTFATNFDHQIVNDDLERAASEAIEMVRQFLAHD